MKKFLSRLAIVSIAMIVIIVGMHAVAILNLQDDVDSAYTIDKSTEVLFVGSSQLGCSIADELSQKYHFQKLWVSDTITPAFLMRLRELERRGQLDGIKTVVVPFNIHSVTAQSERGYLWSWYQELPVSWRYMDIVPYSRIDFFRYIFSNLRFPFHIHVCDTPPERAPLSKRPQHYREKAIESFVLSARNLEARGSSVDWERMLFDAYDEMSKICERHKIKFVVYKAPLLPQFEENISTVANMEIAKYEQRLADMGIRYVVVDINLDERHFIDSVHLEMSSAKLYTEALFAQIK